MVWRRELLVSGRVPDEKEAVRIQKLTSAGEPVSDFGSSGTLILPAQDVGGGGVSISTNHSAFAVILGERDHVYATLSNHTACGDASAIVAFTATSGALAQGFGNGGISCLGDSRTGNAGWDRIPAAGVGAHSMVTLKKTFSTVSAYWVTRIE